MRVGAHPARLLLLFLAASAPAHAADDPALRYRSGMQVTAAAYAGAAVGLGMTLGGDLRYAQEVDPRWVSQGLTSVGLLGLSFSTSMAGAGTLASADALHSAGCSVNIAPGVAAQTIGYVSTGVDIVAAVASAVRTQPETPAWALAATSQYVGLAATGVRLGLSGVQVGLDRAAARRCPGVRPEPGRVTETPSVGVGPWVMKDGLGVRMTVGRW